MSNHEYSTAISHIVLAGTSLYCLRAGHFAFPSFPAVSYGIVITNSIIGIWRYGNPDNGNNAKKIYKWTSFIQEIFFFPLMVGQMWLSYGYDPIFSYIHPIVSLLPLAMRAQKEEVREDLLDTILGANAISGGIVSFLAENYWGIGAAVSFLIQHFIIKKDNSDKSIPTVDLCNYGLCFVCYFVLRTFT